MRNKLLLCFILMSVFFLQCKKTSYQPFRLVGFHSTFEYLVYSNYRFQPSDSLLLVKIFRCNNLDYKYVNGQPLLKIDDMREDERVHLSSTFICISGKHIKDLMFVEDLILIPCNFTPVVDTKECLERE